MLVFVHINKTAGRTMRYILRSSYGARHCEVEPWNGTWHGRPFSNTDLQRLRKIYPKLVSIAGHRLTGYVDLSEPDIEFKYFTFVRDPVALCASRFQYQIDYRKKKTLLFREWIAREDFRNAQTKQIAGSASVDDAIQILTRKEIFVGLTERFDESIVMLKNLRAPDLRLGYERVNVATRNSIARELLADRRARQEIIDANQSDIALYRYVETQLYPSFQRTYGSTLRDDVAAYVTKGNQGFDGLNLAASRLKQYAVYRPLLGLHRRQRTRKSVQRLLG